MYILKSTSTLYVLTFGLLLHTVFGADPIFQICQTSDNFTTNNPYVSNLNKLMCDLAYKVMALILVQWVSNTTKHMGLLFVVVMSQKLIVLPVLLRQDK